MSTHQSLQRAIAILRQFTELEPALTVSEISERLGIHKSTASRILGTLLADGMVWHNPETGRYSLGMAVVEMAGVALGQIDMRAAALPHMEPLASATGETVTAVVPRGREGVTVAYLPAAHPIRHVVWIGRRIPLRTTAAGKVILAATHATGGDWRAAVGLAELDRPAKWEAKFAAELAAISVAGFAEEVDEFELGTAAVAAPVVGGNGMAVGALAVSGPSARFDGTCRRSAAALLVEAVSRIASDLGIQRMVGQSGSGS